MISDDLTREAPPMIDDHKIHEPAPLIGSTGAQTLSTTALAEIGRLLSLARAALASGDLAEAKAAAHSVKRIAANGAALRLSEDARRLENDASDALAAEPMLDCMVRAWCVARAQLPALIAAAPAAQNAA